MPKRPQEAKTYFCSRPSLAGELMEAGYNGKTAVNPYHPERPGWTFEITLPLAQDVALYYQRIGRPVPRVIADFLSDSVMW